MLIQVRSLQQLVPARSQLFVTVAVVEAEADDGELRPELLKMIYDELVVLFANCFLLISSTRSDKWLLLKRWPSFYRSSILIQ